MPASPSRALAAETSPHLPRAHSALACPPLPTLLKQSIPELSTKTKGLAPHGEWGRGRVPQPSQPLGEVRWVLQDEPTVGPLAALQAARGRGRHWAAAPRGGTSREHSVCLQVRMVPVAALPLRG